MFGRKQKKSIEVTKLSSLIADNLQIVGDVLFSGGLRVDGKIEGNVLGKSDEKSLVVVSEKGCIIGRVQAYDAVVNGTISGDLEVEHFLELQPGARVSGNISYRQLQMDCGATVEGQLVRVAERPAVAPAAEARRDSQHDSIPKPNSTKDQKQGFERTAAPTSSAGVPAQPAVVRRQAGALRAPARLVGDSSEPSAAVGLDRKDAAAR